MGFLDSILSLFVDANNPEARKKRALKQLAGEINKNRYRKFYKASTEEATPVMAKFFYDTYKSVSGAQTLMQNADKSAILKQITIESFMSKELHEIYDRLSPESIAEQAKVMPPKELSAQLQSDLNTFSSALTITDINTIDQCYSQILSLVHFLSFDFFGLLKKVDPRLKEFDVHYHIVMRNINCRFIVENLKEFIFLPAIDTSPDTWKMIFEILRKYKNGVKIMDPVQWKKTLAAVNDVKRSGILTLIVKHISKNPSWTSEVFFEDSRIVESFIKAKKTEVQDCIDKIINDKRSSKRDALSNEVFGSTDVTRLQNYTHVNNELFSKKSIDGFTFVDPLNYIKAFAIDYPEVKEICDLFLIRGQWTTPELSRQISQGLHELDDLYEQLAQFDDNLSEKGTYGIKLRGQLTKFKVDGQLTHLKVTLSIINSEAQEMISRALGSFLLVGGYIKDLNRDYKKKRQLLINWGEIEVASSPPIAERMDKVQNAIDAFAALLELYVSDNSPN